MSAISSVWTKLPVMLRAFIGGFLILISAVIPWSALMQANLSYYPQIPWSVAIGGILLWLLWRFLGGEIFPLNNADARKELRRFHSLRRKNDKWIWIAAVSLGVTITAYAMIKTLTESVGAEIPTLFDALAPLPVWTAGSMLLGGVIMTAFFEETAFRGYMQLPIERRHGPKVAIVFVALIFALVHSPQPAQLPLFVLGSCGWGILTYLTGTIVPAVIIHALVDGVVYFWAWQNTAIRREYLAYNVFESGGSPLFTIWVIIAILGTSLTVYGFIKMKRSGRCISF